MAATEQALLDPGGTAAGKRGGGAGARKVRGAWQRPQARGCAQAAVLDATLRARQPRAQPNGAAARRGAGHTQAWLGASVRRRLTAELTRSWRVCCAVSASRPSRRRAGSDAAPSASALRRVICASAMPSRSSRLATSARSVPHSASAALCARRSAPACVCKPRAAQVQGSGSRRNACMGSMAAVHNLICSTSGSGLCMSVALHASIRVHRMWRTWSVACDELHMHCV